ncbi:transposase [Lactiplantibacillus plantarum]|uniref:transposase n=1 Tax=Lactiplantibacillus plantarum TaxID=1590 RepID=UPI00374FD7CB
MHQFELDYHAKTWSKPYQVVVQSVRTSTELLYQHEFVITNLNTVRSAELFTTYHQLGVVENSIKEAKLVFLWIKLITIASWLIRSACCLVRSQYCLSF